VEALRFRQPLPNVRAVEYVGFVSPSARPAGSRGATATWLRWRAERPGPPEDDDLPIGQRVHDHGTASTPSTPGTPGTWVSEGDLSLLQIIAGTASPTTGTWAVGTRCMNPAPAVGSPKGWVCTVAGTPGTWVSEGNL
jgi:hypothetical protein